MGKGTPSVTTVGDRARKPRPREFRSPGAAVARSIAAMAKPTKVAVVLTETGGSDTMVVSKALRGGRRVLSGPINRYDKIAHLTDVDLVTAAPAAGNPNLAAADLVTAAPAASNPNLGAADLVTAAPAAADLVPAAPAAGNPPNLATAIHNA